MSEAKPGAAREAARGASVYMDYAATSAIRPAEVADAVAVYLRDVGATPGRSGHARALEAGRTALRCRRLIAEIFGIPGDPGRIAFQLNATHALNTALHGALRPGDRLVRTQFDHNAVRRPAAALAARGVRESILSGGADGSVDLAELEHLLAGDGDSARLLAIPHVSNVTGAILPVREMVETARRHDTLVLLDAAQSGGHIPIDVAEIDVDLLAFTGHKGLLGPQGVGGLWVREGVAVEPLLRGGTGGDSAPLGMPPAYPDHLEAGTQNAPGIAGLAAALEWLRGRGVDALRREEARLRAELVDLLDGVPGLRILSPRSGEVVGIVTFVVDWASPSELAAALDRDFGIQGRAGLHCAPEAHQVLGSLESGAYRLSLGWASTSDDVRHAATALHEMFERKAKG